eukprot:scaffold781_cov146-Ochromonas_danica.AAC.1
MLLTTPKLVVTTTPSSPRLAPTTTTTTVSCTTIRRQPLASPSTMNRKEKNIIKTKKNYEEEKDEEDIINNPSSSSSSRSMFQEGFTERYDLEQYFWTMDTVHRLLVGLSHTTDCCCLTTPSLGVGFHEQGREEAVLDIDTRFAYLPKFQYYDLRHPITLEETFSII